MQGPQKRLKALLGEGVPFAQVWAMTGLLLPARMLVLEPLTSHKETTCFATTFPYPLDDDTASVGYPLPGIDLKLVDDAGNDISKAENTWRNLYSRSNSHPKLSRPFHFL